MRTPSRMHLAGVIACLSAVLVAAACGSDDASSSPTASTVTVTQSSAQSGSSTPADASGGDGTEGAPAPTDGGGAETIDAENPAIPTALTSAEANVRLADYRVTNEGVGPGYFFQSPSGNVRCGVHDRNPEFGFGCQATTSVQNPRGPKCLNGGNSVYATFIVNNSVGSRCVNQPFYGGEYINQQNVLVPSKVLDYGQILAVGGVTCASTTAGITCFEGRVGFTMSRDRNEAR